VSYAVCLDSVVSLCPYRVVQKVKSYTVQGQNRQTEKLPLIIARPAVDMD